MFRFSTRRRFLNADILPVLIPLSLLPVFVTVTVVANFFSVANGYRPLPIIRGICGQWQAVGDSSALAVRAQGVQKSTRNVERIVGLR
jgi:hypothetical protein